MNKLLAVLTVIYLSSGAVARPLEVNYTPQTTWEAPKEEIPFWKIWDNTPQDHHRDAVIQMLQQGDLHSYRAKAPNIVKKTPSKEENQRLGRQILGLGMILGGMILMLLSIEWWLNRSEQYKFWKQYRRRV